MAKVLTISIAAYNTETTIRRALDSLIDTDIIDDLEILVIDDGGTDNTLQIAREYAARYPTSVIPVHKENGGYGSVINTAIDLATGKYFKQLDGDDWYNTDGLKALVSVLKEVTVDCVLTDFIRYFEAAAKEVYYECCGSIPDGLYTMEVLEYGHSMSMYIMTFRTELLKDMHEQIDEHCFYTDLEYIVFPMFYIETVYVLHKSVYMYCAGIDGQSTSAAGIAKHYKEHEQVFWRLFRIYESLPDEKAFNRKILGDMLANMLGEHMRFLCVLPTSSAAKHELVDFYHRIKNAGSELLAAARKQRKVVNVLVWSNFLLYRPMSYWTRMKWKQVPINKELRNMSRGETR